MCCLKYAMRVTQQQCEAAKADSCQQAAPKQHASALVSSRLVPLRCAPLIVFVSHGKQLEKAQKHAEDCLFLCVPARRVEMVIFRKQWGREESSRWSDRAQLPNEVSLVAPGVKKTLRSSPPLPQKGSSPKIYFTLYFYS